MRTRSPHDQVMEPIGGHSGHWQDPALWRLVDELADELTVS
jgi:hypothetical protein